MKITNTLNSEDKKKIKTLINNASKVKTSSATKAQTKASSSKNTTIPSAIKYTTVSESKTPTVAEALAEVKALSSSNLSDVAEPTIKYYTPKKDDSIFREVDNMPKVGDNKDDSQDQTESEEPQDNLTTASSLQEVLNKIDALNDLHSGKVDSDYYEHLLPEIKESLGLEKLEDVVIDETDIAKQVEEKLNALYNEKKESAKTSTDNSVNSILEQMESLKTDAKSSEAQINQAYNTAIENVNGETLKRGLARSSIAILNISGLKKEQAQSLSELANSLMVGLNQAEQEIANLNNELETSLEALDLELAMNINEEINEKIEELKEKQQEVIQFNNNIDKLEAEYQIKRNDAVKDNEELKKQLAEDYKGVAEATKNQDIYTLCINYFNTMSKTDALNELINSTELRNALGKKYIDVYYSVMSRKD